MRFAHACLLSRLFMECATMCGFFRCLPCKTCSGRLLCSAFVDSPMTHLAQCRSSACLTPWWQRRALRGCKLGMLVERPRVTPSLTPLRLYVHTMARFAELGWPLAEPKISPPPPPPSPLRVAAPAVEPAAVEPAVATTAAAPTIAAEPVAVAAAAATAEAGPEVRFVPRLYLA